MGIKLRGRAREFAKLDEKPSTDFDPEADNAPSENDDDQDDSDEENAGTEHYVQVGKSKLRKNEGLTLGPNYRGTRVSRKALEEAANNAAESASDDDDDDEDNDDEEFDDPETADLTKDQARITDDELIESDEAFGESDEEFVSKFTFRGSSKPNLAMTRKNRPKASDFMDGDDQEDEEEEEKVPAKASKVVIDDERSEESEEGDDDDEEDSEDDDEEDFEGLEDEDEDEDEDEGEDEDEDEDDEEDDEDDQDSESDDDDQDETTNRNFNPANHLSALSAAAKQEVLKGMAVRDQRKLFDGLLNFRIRLQKALVAANSLSLAQDDDDDNTSDSDYDTAEQAALQLWSTLENIRGHLTSSMVKGSQKRKYEVDSTTATPTIWGYMQDDEAEALKHRRITLDKWSRRVGPSAATSRNQLKATSNSICAVLDEQLSEPARLIKRTQVPRSCAPGHAARKIGEDAGIYDDADFYQLLLKELVEQRSAENDQAAGEAVATVRWAAMKEAKTRKVVDRKASRGRKLKFTVHEKLQSFMAPEDRRQWEEEAIDRLFSTLLGQQVMLDEEDHKDEDDNEDEDMDAEEEGLMLFRS